jgi:hypothetical protein
MFWSKKQSPWQGLDFMELVPEPSREVEIDPQTGAVKVLIPRYDSWPFNRLIQPRLGPEKRFLRVPLEERGSFLWGLMDGRRTVGEMIPEFNSRFPDDAGDVPQRLATFFYTMQANKFIRFAGFPL